MNFVTKLQKYNFAYNLSTNEECKILGAVVPDELLVANADGGFYQIEENQNSSLVVILHCLNSFQNNNYVVFSLFISTA